MAATTRVLRQEHQAIREALNFAEGLSIKIENGQQIPTEVLARVMNFFRLFVDQCHHSKEEEIFFPLLERQAMGSRGLGLFGAHAGALRQGGGGAFKDRG